MMNIEKQKLSMWKKRVVPDGWFCMSGFVIIPNGESPSYRPSLETKHGMSFDAQKNCFSKLMYPGQFRVKIVPLIHPSTNKNLYWRQSYGKTCWKKLTWTNIAWKRFHHW